MGLLGDGDWTEGMGPGTGDRGSGHLGGFGSVPSCPWRLAGKDTPQRARPGSMPKWQEGRHKGEKDGGFSGGHGANGARAGRVPPGPRLAGSRNKLSRPAAGARDQLRSSVASGRWSAASGPRGRNLVDMDSGNAAESPRGLETARRLGSEGRGENGAAMRGSRVDGKKIRRLHGARAARIRPSMIVHVIAGVHLVSRECPEISSTPQHDTTKSQDVTSSATTCAPEQNTRNRTWYDDSFPKRKRSSLSGEYREQQGPTRRRTPWEGPGTALGQDEAIKRG